MMLSTLLQCCIVIAMQIKLTVVVVVVACTIFRKISMRPNCPICQIMLFLRIKLIVENKIKLISKIVSHFGLELTIICVVPSNITNNKTKHSLIFLIESLFNLLTI